MEGGSGDDSRFTFPTSLASEEQSSPGPACGDVFKLRDMPRVGGFTDAPVRPGQVSVRETDMEATMCRTASSHNGHRNAGIQGFAKSLGFPTLHEIGGGLFAVVCMITPAMAKNILSNHNSRNRKEVTSASSQLTREMSEGRWQLTAQAISFATDKNLNNGQHRLICCATSDRPIECLVVFGESEEAMKVTDIGTGRTAKQIADLLGMEVDNTMLSACKRAMDSFGGQTKRSPGELFDFMESHQDALRFTMANLRSKQRLAGICIGPVMGAVLRAYYHVDHSRLAAFCEELRTGVPVDNQELSAVTLRNMLIGLITGKQYRGIKASAVVLYSKAERAILGYSKLENLTKVYGFESELFALPEEKSASSSAE